MCFNEIPLHFSVLRKISCCSIFNDQVLPLSAVSLSIILHRFAVVKGFLKKLFNFSKLYYRKGNSGNNGSKKRAAKINDVVIKKLKAREFFGSLIAVHFSFG